MARFCRRSSAPRVWVSDRTPRWRPRRGVVAIAVTASAETVAVVAASAVVIVVVIVAVAANVPVERRVLVARRVLVGEDRLRLALGGHGQAPRARDRVHHARRAHRLPKRRLPVVKRQ